MKIKKGDRVKVLLGKDRGREGTIEKVSHKKSKIWVTGVNVYKRHVSGKRVGMVREGGIIDIQKPLNVSNVALICPNCKKPTRIGFLLVKGNKSRICKKCGKEIVNEVKG